MESKPLYIRSALCGDISGAENGSRLKQQYLHIPYPPITKGIIMKLRN